MKQKMFLTAAALVLLFLNLSPAWSQTGVLEELDPNILWVADSSIGRIDGFTVHPNGNIFAYRNGANGIGEVKRELKVFEIDGNTGKLIRQLPKFSEDVYLESIDISDDGRYLATSYTYTYITDLNSGVSKNLMKGVRAKFLPNSSKIAILGPKNTDSSIVILDLVTEQRTYIKTEEGIHKIAFSPDGRFFATGGSLYTGGFIPSYTSLKLWDANTLKLIKELEKLENSGYTPSKIEFSPDNRLVAFKKYGEISIYDVNDFSEFKNYSDSNTNLSSSGFSWIDKNHIGINSKFISVFRLSDDKRTDIFEFSQYFGRWLLTNTLKNILYSGTGYPDKGEVIIAFDLNKVFSTVEYKSDNTTIQASYQKGILFISGLQETSNMVNLEIFDISGRIIRKLDIQTNGAEIRVPLILPKGTYLLNLKDGEKEYSSKFLVVE